MRKGVFQASGSTPHRHGPIPGQGREAAWKEARDVTPNTLLMETTKL
jgi:hypothetical protein